MNNFLSLKSWRENSDNFSVGAKLCLHVRTWEKSHETFSFLLSLNLNQYLDWFFSIQILYLVSNYIFLLDSGKGLFCFSFPFVFILDNFSGKMTEVKSGLLTTLLELKSTLIFIISKYTITFLCWQSTKD